MCRVLRVLWLQGEWLRHYSDLSERPAQAAEGADDLGPVPPSSAYTRRVAGTHWE